MTTQTIAKPKPAGEPQVKGPQMNDRDRLNDILTLEKSLTTSYNTALNELQNPNLHQTAQTILNDVHAQQLQVFNQMWEKGWYKIKAANQQEISQTHQQFSGYRTQFPQFQ